MIDEDGGWKNANQVREDINELGGPVDVWFITHFNNDHVDAFNGIWRFARNCY